MYILGYPLQAISHILGTILFLYTIVIIASAVISWVRLDPWHPVVRVLNALTLPFYRRLRRFVPQMGAVDFTPLVALLIIMFLQEGVLPILYRLAAYLIGDQG